MRALRLLPACLLALAACTVDTESLKAKTDAECAAVNPLTKACGYRCVSYGEPCGRAPTYAECAAADPATKACGAACVSRNDPAVGCSTSGVCTPCPSGPLGERATCSAGACSYAPSSCPAPLFMCGSACQDLRAAPLHCGACDHACPGGSACTGGVCAPSVVVQGTGLESPRDLTCHENGRIAFYDAAWMAWYSVNTAFPSAYYPVDQFAGPFGLTALLTSPTRRATTPTDIPYVYFAGRDATGTGGAIWEYDYYWSANTPIDTSPSEKFSGLARSDRWVYWTGTGGAVSPSVIHWVEQSPFGGGSRGTGSQEFAPDATSFQGLATVYASSTGTWHVFALSGSLVVHLEEVGGLPTLQDFWYLTAPADRIAATESPSGYLRLYLGNSTNGRVWRFDELGAPVVVQDQPSPAGRMDLVADVHGAYWTVSGQHQVMEYRASDGALFPLADTTTAGTPWGICLGPKPGYVAWSDTTGNVVRAVLK